MSSRSVIIRLVVGFLLWNSVSELSYGCLLSLHQYCRYHVIYFHETLYEHSAIQGLVLNSLYYNASMVS
jgi:hypothetical protein